MLTEFDEMLAAKAAAEAAARPIEEIFDLDDLEEPYVPADV
jgi:hypothetical protein